MVPKAGKFFTSHKNQSIKIWEIQVCTRIYSILTPLLKKTPVMLQRMTTLSPIVLMCASDDGALLFTALEDSSVICWDSKGKNVGEFKKGNCIKLQSMLT